MMSKTLAGERLRVDVAVDEAYAGVRIERRLARGRELGHPRRGVEPDHRHVEAAREMEGGAAEAGADIEQPHARFDRHVLGKHRPEALDAARALKPVAVDYFGSENIVRV